jgi:hypothetical protein
MASSSFLSISTAFQRMASSYRSTVSRADSVSSSS